MIPSKKIIRIISDLEIRFGIPIRAEKTDALSCLIKTILSQNTNDRNRDMAYYNLTHSFPTWESILNADLTDVITAIRSAGLANQKGRYIKDILKWIQDSYSELNIDFLAKSH